MFVMLKSNSKYQWSWPKISLRLKKSVACTCLDAVLYSSCHGNKQILTQIVYWRSWMVTHFPCQQPCWDAWFFRSELHIFHEPFKYWHRNTPAFLFQHQVLLELRRKPRMFIKLSKRRSFPSQHKANYVSQRSNLSLFWISDLAQTETCRCLFSLEIFGTEIKIPYSKCDGNTYPACTFFAYFSQLLLCLLSAVQITVHF